jgi:hypothetical protein
MKIAINYSNEEFRRAAKFNAATAKLFGKVDNVICYKFADIDADFKQKNDRIFQNKRGDGLWLWKPYFIHRTLVNIEENDYLIYSDSGMCFLRDVDILIEKMKNSGQDLFFTETPLLEIQFTHPNVFELLDASRFRFTNQIQAGLLIIRKTYFTMSLIKEWLELCQNIELLSGEFADGIKESLFISHREDQSLFSLLMKKYNILPFKDCTDYGRYPLQYFQNNIILNVPFYSSIFMVRQTFFLLFRRSNPLWYYCKYLLKRLFTLFGFSRNYMLTRIANLN